MDAECWYLLSVQKYYDGYSASVWIPVRTSPGKRVLNIESTRRKVERMV
jgi:hypothetical protein